MNRLLVLYLDTSSLLKLLLPEPESKRVQEFVAQASVIVVSALAELETEVQLRAGWLAGDFTHAQYRRLITEFHSLRHQEPFDFRSLPGTMFQTALELHRASPRPHVRTLDQLHLAAMEELKLRRLITHDRAQAKAAAMRGYEVFSPA